MSLRQRLVRRTALALCFLFLGVASPFSTPAARANDNVGLPVLAYYYIWYQATSWDRAKSDLPLLGRYSSDQRSVMLHHAEAAKAAGLDGFLVSWKNTPELDSRLATLVDVAQQVGLKIGIIYQGLDFYRRPLPASQVARDMTWLSQTYGSKDVFSIFDGKPLVIWSGTWEFTPQQVQKVGHRVGKDVVLLASARNVQEYSAIAPYVDGDAYYWSSLDPSRDIHAADDLAALGEAVHSTGGLWIPSAAPGFDATLLGGHRVVPRNNGQTLRDEWSLAVGSSPDAVGIISWNEFSENTAIEPSRNYGNQSLRTLADILGATVPDSIAADSSFPGAGSPASTSYQGILVLVIGGGIVFVSLVVLARRDIKAKRFMRITRQGKHEVVENP